ncbi:MAG: hypothetical protein JST39_09275, partial [Bacteroidetes bacterium]|nr:hypothetical protein [Bacteroidota bacterium]
SWKDNSGLGKAAATDKALLICLIDGMKGPYHTTEAAVRGDETATLDMSKLKGYRVHTWVAFMAADNSTANSVYTGAFTLGGEIPEAANAFQNTALEVVETIPENTGDHSPATIAPITTNTDVNSTTIAVSAVVNADADSPADETSLNGNAAAIETLLIKQELDFQIILQSPDKGTDYALQKGHGPNREPVQRQLTFDDDLLFRFRIGIQQGKDGLPDFTGPFVQGPPGERFICICTGAYAGQKYTSTGRRLKIPLSNISWELIRKTLEQGDQILHAAVKGKSERGAPVSETIRPADGWTLLTETKR